MIRDFLIQLTDKQLNYKKIGKKYFLISGELEKASSEINDEVFSIGMFLGEEDKKNFIPSLALLQWLNGKTKKMAVVDEKAAWLFLCGRDIFKVGVIKSTVEDGPVLVYNEKEEVLGYGKFSRKGIKNIRHLGEYLKDLA